ncbi:hypothetical protein EJB05_33588, partial [Eragrostis curvula]
SFRHFFAKLPSNFVPVLSSTRSSPDRGLIAGSASLCAPATDLSVSCDKLSIPPRASTGTKISFQQGLAGVTASLPRWRQARLMASAGTNDPDLRLRRELFGVNTYPKRKTKSVYSHFWDAARDVFLVVLLVCAGLSLGFGIKERGVKDGWYDGVGMFVSVFLIATMSAVGNHCHAKLFDQLCTDSEVHDNNPVKVIRGGKSLDVLTSDVVVGDVVQLYTGDIVPADGVIIEIRTQTDGEETK